MSSVRETVYRLLASLYKYTVEDIANMTPYQQHVLLDLDDNNSDVIKFADQNDYAAWLAARKA